MEGFKAFREIKQCCDKIIKAKDASNLVELREIVKNTNNSTVRSLQPMIFSCLYPLIKDIAKGNSNLKKNEKEVMVNLINEVLKKSIVAEEVLFFNIYSFLLFEIYDHINHKVLVISEEYKLCIIECVKSLADAVSYELVETLYRRENAPKFCQFVYVAVELAKTEQMRALRLASLECILSLGKISNEDDFNDLVLRDQVADIFCFCLPGVSSMLTQLALSDEKIGHKIPSLAIKAYGRAVTLLMQNYNPQENNLRLEKLSITYKNTSKEENLINNNLSTERNTDWYKKTDEHLQKQIEKMLPLTHHSHYKVRLELMTMCNLIITNCLHTMPNSIGHLTTIVISLTEDENQQIALQAKNLLNDLSSKLNEFQFRNIFEKAVEGFHNTLNRLPRIFNGIDEKEKLTAINLLVGYITLFNEQKVTEVLLCGNVLNKLMETLLYICELEKNESTLLEEYSQDLEVDEKVKWKKFRHFRNEQVEEKLGKLCFILAQLGCFSFIYDYIIGKLELDNNRKEALFILNQTLLGLKGIKNDLDIFRPIIDLYIDSSNWNLPIVIEEDDEYEYTLSDIQDNIIQACLLVEGIGYISLTLGNHFKLYLLRVLYLVLERAGNERLSIRSAGIKALSDISKACNYETISSLVNENIDYLSYFAEKKLRNRKELNNSLNMFSVIFKYSTKKDLEVISAVVADIIPQKCNYSHLRLYKMYLTYLYNVLEVQTKVEPIKTKIEKEKEVEDFQISNVEEIKDFSDDIMGKTAEEMYREDLEKKQEETQPEDEYKKPDSPTYIKLTVAILKKALHILPSKDGEKQLAVLSVLLQGVEILRDFEDDLLPIVHQIWSPLVGRFKDNYLIVNGSFKLLCTLAKLSKEFIRSRTTKEVIPHIIEIMEKLAKESYLKDRGSTYRYSQAYKLQISVLENVARLLCDLDVLESCFNNVSGMVFNYLSKYQPKPLQILAVNYFTTMFKYDPKPVEDKLKQWLENKREEFDNNLIFLNDTLIKV